MLVPVFARVLRADRLDPQGHRLHVLRVVATTWPAGRSRSCRRSTRSARWPPVNESHVEMDGAWALYEAWVKIQTGEVDTALVYGFGKSSPGDLRRGAGAAARPVLRGAALARRRVASPRCRPGPCSTPGCGDERRWPRWSPRSRRDARRTTRTRSSQGRLVGRRAARRAEYADPLRKHDCAPITDGAAAIVLAAGDRARERARPAGVDPRHRPPHRAASASGVPRPHRAPPRPRSPASRPASAAAASTWPSCTRRSATRS